MRLLEVSATSLWDSLTVMQLAQGQRVWSERSRLGHVVGGSHETLTEAWYVAKGSCSLP